MTTNPTPAPSGALTIAELRGQVAHLRDALAMLTREAARDWLEHVHSDAALDALEYARRTLKATEP